MKLTTFATLAAAGLLLAGCFANMAQPRRGTSSSLVDFLYPAGETPPPLTDAVPRLNLPLRVGLAFVPSHNTLAA